MRRSKSPASEPTLSEALSDPIVQMVMRRDGLTAERVLAEVIPVARHLARRAAASIDAAA